MSLDHREPGQGPNRLLTTKQAADYLNLGVSTLNRWRIEGIGPEYTVLGAVAVRYPLHTLDDFAANGMRRSTSEVLDHG